MIRLCSSFWNMKRGSGVVQIDLARKNIPSKSPVLQGLIYLLGVLLNCKSTSGESRASKSRVYHFAISQ